MPLTLAVMLSALTGCLNTPAARPRPRHESTAAPSVEAAPAQPAAAAMADAGTAQAAADEPLDLLAALVANGALTEEQAAQAAKDPRFAPREQAPVQGSGSKPKAETRTILDDTGLSIRSGDGATRIDIGGRLQADASVHSRDSVNGMPITDGTELRRARIELKGNMADGWMWAAETDFADNRTSIKDFWAGVTTDGGTSVMFGHQKQPFSLAVEMSSNDIPFTERGIDTDLVIPFIDRAIGVRVDSPSENSFFSAGVFGDGVDANPSDDEGWGTAMRYVNAPILEQDEVLHLGVRGAYRVPMSSTQSVRIRDESTHLSNFNVVDTGTITDINAAHLWGAEFAYANGPYSFGGEWNSVDLDRDTKDLEFYSWHIETAYTLTGESRAKTYNIGSGEFKRLKPATTAKGLNVCSGGAWELAARLANLDLTDDTVSGGEARALTLGVNWYPNDFTRFLLGWTSIVRTRGGSATTEDAEGLGVFALRGQMTF